MRAVEVEVDRVADVVGDEAARAKDGQLAPEDLGGAHPELVQAATR